jgi:hypothetical protein
MKKYVYVWYLAEFFVERLMKTMSAFNFPQKISHNQLCYISLFGDLRYKFRPVVAIIRLL